MPMSLHQRQQQQKPLVYPSPISPRSIRASSLSGLLSLLVFIGTPLPWPLSRWRDYTLPAAAAFVGSHNGTVILCAVSRPYLPFLNNWVISVARHHQVLVVDEDYATLYQVNRRWPGHAVLVPPAPDGQEAHKFNLSSTY